MSRNLKTTIFIALAGAGLLSVSCHKRRIVLPEEGRVTSGMVNGLPAETAKINGYLYASESLHKSQSPDFTTTTHLFAAFRDPGMDIMRLYNHITNTAENSDFEHAVDVGELKYNYVSLSNLSSVLYQSGFSVYPTSEFPYWSSEGNKTFKPLYDVVSRGFPALIDSAAVIDTIFIKPEKSYTFKLDSFATNYDSLSIQFTNIDFLQRKSVPRGVSSIEFSYEDLLNFFGQFTTIKISGYNYSNRTISDKVMVYELSRQLNFGVVVTIEQE